MTKGPWELQTWWGAVPHCQEAVRVLSVHDANGVVLADIAKHSVANLIAAAPELLEALEAAVECGMVPITSAKDGGAAALTKHAHVADMIRNVIAKAKGELS